MGSDESIAKIGDAFDLVNGFAFKSADFVESGIPVIKIKNVKAGEFSEQAFSYVEEKFLDKRKDKLARIGDLLISMSGNRHDGSPHTWVGKVAYFNKLGRYFINQRVGALRPKKGVELDLKFAAYVLASMSYQEHFIAVATSSGGQANLSPAQILGAPLSLPCYAEQHEIGCLISTLDDRIDLLRKTSTTLEATAQALFKSWFVDIDPVHAKAEGREPDGMDAATAALFPDSFEDSPLGPIPQGWRTDEIGNVVNCIGGATPSTKEPSFWEPSEHHWVTPKDLSGLAAPVLMDTNRKVSTAGLKKISSGTLPKGTLLLSSRAPIGYLAITQIPTAINQGFIAMPPGGELPPAYLLFWTQWNMDSIKQKANGSTFMEISKSAFRPIKLCVPPEKIVTAFVSIAEPLLERIAANEAQRTQLTQLRDTLLPRLISGKLRLPDAQTLIEEATP